MEAVTADAFGVGGGIEAFNVLTNCDAMTLPESAVDDVEELEIVDEAFGAALLPAIRGSRTLAAVSVGARSVWLPVSVVAAES